MIKHTKISLLAGLLLAVGSMPGMVMASPILPSSDADARQVEKNWVPQETKNQALVNQTGTQTGQQAQKATFRVTHITFEGVENKAELQALDGLATKYIRHSASMDDFSKLSAEIHNYYLQEKGYLLTEAVLPPQTIKDGNVIMRVYYGRIGKVSVNNKSKFKTYRLNEFAHVIQDGEIIKQRKVNDVVNNIDNLHGIKAHGVLSAGTVPGTADLTINVVDRQASSTALFVDNTGNKMTGTYRVGFNTQLDDLSSVGDMLTFGATTSNKHTHNYNIGYEIPVGNRGTVVGIGFSRMNYAYDLNQYLNATGDANTYSIYAKTPIINDGWRLVNFVYGYDHRDITDTFELSPFTFDIARKSDAGYIGLAGHFNTPSYYTGYNFFLRNGFVNYDDSSLDKDHFQRMNLDVVHVQHFAPRWDLRLNLHGQTSSQSLDSSEQMSLGGINGVRAYPQGEATGDKGLQYTAELVYKTGVQGLSLSAYLDGGYIVQNSTDTSRHLSGYGIGIEYMKPMDWFVRLDYARKIHAEYNYSERTDDKDRIWFQVYKLF
jgi:hemolysin activation/secretion protein